jgi:hypothetical protein
MKKNNLKIEDIIVIVLLTLICLMFMIYILKQTDILKTETNIGNDTNITEDQVNIDIDMNDNKSFLEERIDRRLVAPGYIYEPRPYAAINIRTRGMPTEYQQMGILTNVNDPDDVKPFFGRQTYVGSNSWNYYSSLDSNLSTKIPVYKNNTRCTDEHGCKEIYEGDEVRIGNVSNKTYILTKYSSDSFRYIPDLI